MARVLTAYGTGEGQTASISEYIAEVVRDRCHDVEVIYIKGFLNGCVSESLCESD